MSKLNVTENELMEMLHDCLDGFNVGSELSSIGITGLKNIIIKSTVNNARQKGYIEKSAIEQAEEIFEKFKSGSAYIFSGSVKFDSEEMTILFEAFQELKRNQKS